MHPGGFFIDDVCANDRDGTTNGFEITDSESNQPDPVTWC